MATKGNGVEELILRRRVCHSGDQRRRELASRRTPLKNASAENAVTPSPRGRKRQFEGNNMMDKDRSGSPVYSKRTPASARRQNSHSIKSPNNRNINSPNTSQIFSLDSSFFNSCVQEIDLATETLEEAEQEEEEEDMFAEDEPEEGAKIFNSSSDEAKETQASLCSLPLSVLDIKARVLDETLADRTESRKVEVTFAASESNKFPSRHLVDSERDRGPFYGLPDRVRQLYKDVKGISELFAWQAACLLSPAVQHKRNLLYSLPTSGGKTLVAEIIMLQELLCYRKNVIFVLPYVSLVQEKIRSLAPFALELGFYLEEYAGARGRFPPQKRRQKRSLFVCTIEKAHALFNSLVVEQRLRHEVGLVVIDEIHMLAEPVRGAHLECLVAKVKHLNSMAGSHSEEEPKSNGKIQLVAMSATVGNLREMARFLDNAELFTDAWRPVRLEEYVKVGREIYHVADQQQRACAEGEELKLARRLDTAAYTPAMKQMDEDFLTELILEVFPAHSCLVFCDTKRRCENVAELVAKMIYNRQTICQDILIHREAERSALAAQLRVEGGGFICPVLAKTLPFGIAYHHSGMTMDERKLLEEAFLTGVVGVLCCTSTLAAGVNLPARRVIIRSPFMGRSQLTHSQYKQMAGRAGRAGLDTFGEAVLMVRHNQTRLVPQVVSAPVEDCVSALLRSGGGSSGGEGLATLLLNSIYLKLVDTLHDAKALVAATLMSEQRARLGLNVEAAIEQSLQMLFTHQLISTADESDATQQHVEAGTGLKPTRLGRACIQGNIDIVLAKRLYRDLSDARPHLAVDTCLHLLYLVTPYDLADAHQFSAALYHQIYSKLAAAEAAVARSLGITEAVVVGMMTGRPLRNKQQMQPILGRFFLSLVLFDLWNASSIHTVAEKFSMARGDIQSLMGSAASFASSVLHFCREIEEFWAYQELLEPFARRLAHCCSPELLPLLDLPGVKAGRAKQLHQAGYTSLAAVARATPHDLVGGVQHLSHKAAQLMVQAAKLLLIEKAESLQEEADEVLLLI